MYFERTLAPWPKFESSDRVLALRCEVTGLAVGEETLVLNCPPCRLHARSPRMVLNRRPTYCPPAKHTTEYPAVRNFPSLLTSTSDAAYDATRTGASAMFSFYCITSCHLPPSARVSSASIEFTAIANARLWMTSGLRVITLSRSGDSNAEYAHAPLHQRCAEPDTSACAHPPMCPIQSARVRSFSTLFQGRDRRATFARGPFTGPSLHASRGLSEQLLAVFGSSHALRPRLFAPIPCRLRTPYVTLSLLA